MRLSLRGSRHVGNARTHTPVLTSERPAGMLNVASVSITASSVCAIYIYGVGMLMRERGGSGAESGAGGRTECGCKPM